MSVCAVVDMRYYRRSCHCRCLQTVCWSWSHNTTCSKLSGQFCSFSSSSSYFVCVLVLFSRSFSLLLLPRMIWVCPFLCWITQKA